MEQNLRIAQELKDRAESSIVLSIYVHRQCELSKCHRSNWDALSWISCINNIVASTLLILLLTNSCSYGRIYSKWYTVIYWCTGSQSYTDPMKHKDCHRLYYHFLSNAWLSQQYCNWMTCHWSNHLNSWLS